VYGTGTIVLKDVNVNNIMNIQEQIKVVKELLEATKELNGEYQEGWESTIEDGERLLNHLNFENEKTK
jgi:hypothetical protein